MSLIEVTVSAMLVSLVLIGALRGVGQVWISWRTSAQDRSATALAEYVMSEILQQQYRDPDANETFGLESDEVGSDRWLWDDVDDYHNMQGPITRRDGTLLEDYSAWSCAVQVELADLDAPSNSSLGDEGLKRIDVTITQPGGRTTGLTAYRSQWGALEQPGEGDVVVSSWVQSVLRPRRGHALYRGVQLPNHAVDH